MTTCAWNDMHDSNDINTTSDVDDSNDRLNGLEAVQPVKARQIFDDYQITGMQAAASSLGMLSHQTFLWNISCSQL